MAGIGLRLRNLVADQTYLRGAAAYFSSGVIAAGPWLISVISLALLQGSVAAFLPADDRMVLFATITYVFVSSSILTSPSQIVLTRVVADRIFLREAYAIAPIFTRTLVESIIPLTCAAVPWLIWAPFEFPYRLLVGSLFLTISLVWLVLAVISAAQDYVSLVLSFLVGYAISAGATVALGRQYGLSGALAGFALGQVICLALLVNRIFLEFPGTGQLEIPPSRYWREYWSLAMVGLFYSVGLWAEKLFYWFSPTGVVVGGFFRTFPPYDSAILLAYLLTIPASAVFVVNLETDFYQHYREFYMQILKKPEWDGSQTLHGTLEQITQARLAMMASVRAGLWTLLKVQGMVAAFAFLFAPDLARLLGLAGNHLATLCVAILAAGGQVFVLYAVLLLLYLDARQQVVIVVLVFAVGSVSLTALTALLVPRVYGLGYLLSTIIASLMGLRELISRLAKLDYLTFMLQPLEPTGKSGVVRERLRK